MLIGLTGYAQHGKDTVGKYLVDHYDFTRFAFADALKEMALVLNPVIKQYTFPKRPERLATLVQLLGWERAKQDAEVRRFLQVLGTEAVRGFLGEDAWVSALQKQIQAGFSRHQVITDVRFPNEAGAIELWGGQLWRVHRLDPAGGDYDNGIGTDHPSEAHVAELPIDRLLVATSIHELQFEVEMAMMTTPAADRA